MTQVIDLRSDTVSKPSDAMRRAIANAEVGDDVFGDDPTVNRLEAMAAAMMGKDAAVYVPSGTMANLLAVMTHTHPGEEILAGDQCHIFNYEVAGAARIANVQTHPLPNITEADASPGLPPGSLDPERVRAAIREPAGHVPRTSLLCLENTHNRCGGAAIPRAAIDELATIAHAGGLQVHLDGARIFNAAAALGLRPQELAAPCDTVSFCLSKGLGCPVGSLLCGPADFVDRARRNRKLLGGGMRQVGLLAAAGIFALEQNVARITDDHVNAARLADGLRALGPFRPNRPMTNIVVVDLLEGDNATWLRRLRAAGVLAVPFGVNRLRMVTHINISAGDIEEALRRVACAVEAVPA